MKTMQQQKGMTGVGWVLVFLLIAFFTLIGVKIVPIYMSSMSVGSILSDLEDEPGMSSKSPAEILDTVLKRLDINMISDVGRDDIYLDHSGDTTTVEISYEVRRKFIGNIDVVLSFDKKAEIRSTQ